MIRKQLIVFSAFFFLMTSILYASPSKINWNKLPLKKDIKHYENKEYKILAEYKQAYYDGRCSSTWLWMHLGEKDKIATINGLKVAAKEKDGAIISKPADFYVKTIDEMIESDSDMQHYKLGVIFKTVAVIVHDFDEGIDKDETAKKWLGDYYEAVKKYR